MKNLYLLSGLGADERVFTGLDLSQYNCVFVSWMPPDRHDSVRSYAKKLIPQINTSEPICLLGVSFGGIVAQEMATMIRVEKIIIISSVKSPSEFDWKMVLSRWLRLDSLFTPGMLKAGNLLTADFFFGAHTRGESRLLHRIIRDTDTDFMAWAIKAVMRWKPVSFPGNITHIHGTHDRIFPIAGIRNYIPVRGGSHLMIVNRAKEISALISEALR